MNRHPFLAVVALLVCLWMGLALLAPDEAAAQGGQTATNGAEQTLQTLDAIAIPVRDAPALAERLGGVAGATVLPVRPAPAYAIGDRASFFVGHDDEETTFEIEAELAAAAPGVYLWVESGVAYDPARLNEIAVFLDEQLFPRIRSLFGSEPTPGIDGDPHIYVLNATRLGEGIGGYFNDNSVYPREVVPTSNEREMFVIAVDNVPFESPAYLYVLAHEFVHMIQHHEDENEQTWVTEGMAELGAFLSIGPRTGAVLQFLSNPTLQLNTWDVDQPRSYYGASALFFNYLVERFGPDFVLIHSREPADGIIGIGNALRTLGALDRITGRPVSFENVFADWVMANLLNSPVLGDGRYGYHLIDLGGQRAALTAAVDSYPAALDARSVNQFGTHYILLTSAEPRTLRLDLHGRETVPVVPTEPFSGTHVYWANRSDQSNARLTGRFDLSAVNSATLRFAAWFEMEPFWDYGYISLSADGGATWTVLETPETTAENPNGRGFAPGLTGFSLGGTGDRPAPFIGISYDSNTAIITGVLPESGAAQAGVQPGDRLLAFEHMAFVVGELSRLLDRRQVGDIVTLTVARGEQELDLPVTLGAHPDRRLRPEAAWIEESIDLTPYVGGEVLIRFEYVTDQAFTRNGLVLDDIAIPEIGFFDDAESESGRWVSEGWARIENRLPQEYLLQVVESVNGPSVRRLLSPGDGFSGHWTIEVGPSTPAILAISGMTLHTTQPAPYDLAISIVE